MLAKKNIFLILFLVPLFTFSSIYSMNFYNNVEMKERITVYLGQRSVDFIIAKSENCFRDELRDCFIFPGALNSYKSYILSNAKNDPCLWLHHNVSDLYGDKVLSFFVQGSTLTMHFVLSSLHGVLEIYKNYDSVRLFYSDENFQNFKECFEWNDSMDVDEIFKNFLSKEKPLTVSSVYFSLLAALKAQERDNSCIRKLEEFKL